MNGSDTPVTGPETDIVSGQEKKMKKKMGGGGGGGGGGWEFTCY